MTTLRTVVLVAAALSAGAALAQRGGGGQRGGFRMMGGAGASNTRLLRRNDVQKELKITAEQKTKLTELNSQGFGFGGGQRGGGGGQRGGGAGGGFDREAMMKAIQEREKNTLAILTKTQQTRLKEIGLQMSGGRALLGEEPPKELGLKASQKKELMGLQEKMNEANSAVFQRMQNGEIDRAEIGPLMEKNNKILGGEAEKVLTKAQKAKYDKMKGKKFTPDPDEPNAGFGGRGGGGGGAAGSGRRGGGGGTATGGGRRGGGGGGGF
jgi:hypothetical protein